MLDWCLEVGVIDLADPNIPLSGNQRQRPVYCLRCFLQGVGCPWFEADPSLPKAAPRSVRAGSQPLGRRARRLEETARHRRFGARARLLRCIRPVSQSQPCDKGRQHTLELVCCFRNAVTLKSLRRVKRKLKGGGSRHLITTV